MSKQRIRDLNDAFRRTFAGGRVMLTAGVNALPDADKEQAIEKVKGFSDFTAGNDPHGEHDFGAFELGGQRLFWKIDAYDPSMKFGSNDPSDPTQTTRVLTIMLADDY